MSLRNVELFVERRANTGAVEQCGIETIKSRLKSNRERGGEGGRDEWLETPRHEAVGR